MRSIDDRLVFSATDLSNYLACPHLTLLDRAVQVDGLARPPRYEDPRLDALRERGQEHELAYRARLEAAGRTVVEIAPPPRDLPYEEQWRRRAAETEAALRAGADVVYQAAFYDGTWLGLADFLIRVPAPSGLGDWSYEVVDTKLAREAKGGALLQVLLYSHLLEDVQGRLPEEVHLALGGPEPRDESFRVKDYAAYFRSVRDRLLKHVERDGPQPLARAVDPTGHCDICDWRNRCVEERRAVDHLSFVAGISRRQVDGLRGTGVDRLESLGLLDLAGRPKTEGVSAHALVRIREQARVQLEGRREGRTLHELLEPVVPEAGLAALPQPSPGDIFFDIEGDSFAFRYGLDYLFGWTDSEGRYRSLRALDPDEERRIFEEFLDEVKRRREQWPDMHVYHYAPYEPTALKRLMGRHGTREADVDALLRGKVLVDLYRVVRQALRASVESYSIKHLEPLYGYERDTSLPDANRALRYFEAWLEASERDATGPRLLEVIESYNRDDCASTLRLRDWLEEQRDEVERRTGEAVPRPSPSVSEPPDSVEAEDADIARLFELLTLGVPADEDARTPDQHGRWLLAQSLSFHRREDKSTWWQYYHWVEELSGDDYIEDESTMGGLEYVGPVGTVRRSTIHRYHFPRQDHDMGVGKSVRDPATRKAPGEIVALDETAATIDIQRSNNSRKPHPAALVPFDHIDNDVLRKSLQRLAEVIGAEGLESTRSRRAVADLLMRKAPRCGQQAGAPLVEAGEEGLAAALRLIEHLDDSMLAIQGPPGSGKTYTGARMVTRLLAMGKRVGITATSHKVITNFLDAVCEAADEDGIDFRGVQVQPAGVGCDSDRIVVESPGVGRELLDDHGIQLFAGTAWFWAKEDASDSLDVLFIDEAGQFSLANALAVAQAARSLVLLGDPAQLRQPLKGFHPPGSELSALQHFLGEAETMPRERGIFLERTWRLHPDICAFTSELYYSDRLRSMAGLDTQELSGEDGLGGSGLRLVKVPHAFNQSESFEEVEAVVAVVERLMAGGRTWCDRHGTVRPLTLGDILVVAPYNAHVEAIRMRLDDAARVGTVDKFQGQEAPVVIYSTASSSPEDAPRGMTFLYDPHRLNVATSRAKCLAIIVASPELFAPECRTPQQMRLANGFCRYLELARAVES